MSVSTETNRVQAESFPCAGCGGRMEFDPDSQGLACVQCGRKQPIESPLFEAPEYVYNPNTDEYSAPDWEAMGTRTVRCTGCGAQTVISAATVTVRCPFCSGSYVVNQDSADTGIMPETVMPFKVSRPKALEMFKKWVKSRFWAPKKFKKSGLAPENMNGVYLPFWTFDADLTTQYSGEGGKTYTTTHTRTVNGRTETYTETHVRWYPIAGVKTYHYDDEKVCAVKEANDDLLHGVGGFSTKFLNRYTPAYLAGFVARRYDMGLGEGFSAVRPAMEAKIIHAIEDSNGYDRYRNMHYNHQYNNVKFKHILLPVWLSSYQYQQKLYRFIINGETGKVSGKAPVSPLKVTAAVVIGLAILAAFYYLAQYYHG